MSSSTERRFRTPRAAGFATWSSSGSSTEGSPGAPGGYSRLTTPKSWLPTASGTATARTHLSQTGTSTSTSRRPPDSSAASERPAWRTAARRRAMGGGPWRGGRSAAEHGHRGQRLRIDEPDAVGPPREERREGAGERRGHVLAGVRLGQLPGEVEQRPGRAGPRDRRRLLEDREPRAVAVPAPPDVHAGRQEPGQLPARAARRVQAHRAAEGRIGPGDQTPLDHRRRQRRALERGGDRLRHRPPRKAAAAAASTSLTGTPCSRARARQSSYSGCAPTVASPRRATFTRTSP